MPRPRLLAATIVLALLAGAIPTAQAHGGWRTWIVSAHDADTGNGTVAWYTVDNGTQANPTILVHPGDRVILHVVNLGENNHSFELGAPIDRSVGPIPPGEEESLSFPVPNATGPVPYRDPAWADRGMQGTLDVQEGPRGSNRAPVPSPVWLLAALGTVAIAWASRQRDRCRGR